MLEPLVKDRKFCPLQSLHRESRDISITGRSHWLRQPTDLVARHMHRTVMIMATRLSDQKTHEIKVVRQAAHVAHMAAQLNTTTTLTYKRQLVHRGATNCFAWRPRSAQKQPDCLHRIVTACEECCSVCIEDSELSCIIMLNHCDKSMYNSGTWSISNMALSTDLSTQMSSITSRRYSSTIISDTCSTRGSQDESSQLQAALASPREADIA